MLKLALKLEKQGRSNDRVKEILYEKHEVKDWDQDFESGSESSSDTEDKFEDTTNQQSSSSFVDNRPAKYGGSGFGLGFQNVKVVNKSKASSKKRYNWRQRVEMQEARKHSKEDELDFESSSGSDTSDNDESDTSASNDSDNEADVAESKQSDEVKESGDENMCEEENSSEEEGSESEEDDDTSSVESEASPQAVSEVANEFKNWANDEIKKMEGRTVPLETPKLATEYQKLVRPEDLDDGLHDDSAHVNLDSTRKAFYVNVKRSDNIQVARMKLPVFGEEHKIMEAIHHNDVVVICGETGSGKTTQVPQFLYESGYGNQDSIDSPGMIGITQPRRVAAVSMAKRVAQELGDHGDSVSHQIRFDSTVSNNTKMKFMTDGVLLREMSNDFMLTKYSAIVIDEAHERNINTDILIGLLSRCVRLRAKHHQVNPQATKRLKLIIMSATLRVSDFSENQALFATPPPVLKVEARQYPVAVHFNKRTALNYTEEAFRKTCKIHQRLPRGAILIFMTGQQEITQMVKRLRKEFPFPKATNGYNDMDTGVSTLRVNPRNADIEAEEVDFSVNAENSVIDATDDYDEESTDEEGFEETLEDGQKATDPLYVLPLYSLLPTKEQMKVFQEPPEGSRLCIVATNVAETSLTIPNVKYVVDCGRSKERVFNETNGVQSFEVGWISKASFSRSKKW